MRAKPGISVLESQPLEKVSMTVLHEIKPPPSPLGWTVCQELAEATNIVKNYNIIQMTIRNTASIGTRGRQESQYWLQPDLITMMIIRSASGIRKAGNYILG
jgi:hypothetical protein